MLVDLGGEGLIRDRVVADTVHHLGDLGGVGVDHQISPCLQETQAAFAHGNIGDGLGGTKIITDDDPRPALPLAQQA